MQSAWTKQYWCSMQWVLPIFQSLLTLKVPENLQLYGLYVYYVVHICNFGMLRVKPYRASAKRSICQIQIKFSISSLYSGLPRKSCPVFFFFKCPNKQYLVLYAMGTSFHLSISLIYLNLTEISPKDQFVNFRLNPLFSMLYSGLWTFACLVLNILN